ncbi:hypothetical protein EDD16DRAFT_1889071 [Pisolithus croceorrhizus]|nr:hypothetical protein EDD16DRAFT_1889071 [Pisolithus croceorrhizus]
MYPRLLAFFNNVILRGVLEDLHSKRGFAHDIAARKTAVLETVDAKALSPLAMYNFYRLVDTLVTSKKDSYLDFLQIVAYHTSESRRSALSLLTTFWPAAMGHTVVSNALPVFSYAEQGRFLFAHFSCVSSAASEHPSCGSIKLDSTHMTVSLSRLRQSFTDFYGDIFLSSDDLGKRTYEEISVSSSALWTQLQIYNNGLALGSFSISKEDTNVGDGDFELPYLVELYEAYLSSGKLPVSTSLAEYIQTNSSTTSTASYYAPCDSQGSSSGASAGFLRVDGVGEHADDDDVPRHPYEVVPLSHIYDALGYEFNVVSEGPARHFLSHLHKLGLFCCVNLEPFLPTTPPSTNTECYFPLPLGFDLSVDVETLVSAIESCLSDLDLSVNESGLLLLVRRFWPNGLMSEYALRRLTRTLVGWILSEDDSLATILRDYVSEGRRLPGVRAPTDPVPWPYTQNSRRIPTSSVNNGGDYIASRRSLLHTYTAKWLLALHNQDISVYPAIVFDATHEIASDCTYNADDILLDSQDQSMPTLQRLFNRESDSAARFSTYRTYVASPFRAIGSRGRSPSLAQGSIFMDAVLTTTWLRSVGRQDLQPVVGKTLRFFRHAVESGLQSSNDTSTTPPTPIIIDRDLMFMLDEYFRYGDKEIVGLAAKFLHSFMMNSPYLESFEVDNFILRNVKALCTWLVGASRLFRIIMDVKSPAFQVEDCPWKICVLDIFYFFFQLIWLDEKEEIRTAVETWAQSLLTPQLEVIASCWNSALPVLKPPERLQLVAFLTQLQPHFPAWKVLSWDVIIETLQGDSLTGKKVRDPNEYVCQLQLLRCSVGNTRRSDWQQGVALILLSLQMIESGMDVDVFSCLNLKYHLAKLVGFNDVEAIPTASGRSFYVRFEKLESIPAIAFPCVQAFPRILDAHHNFELPPAVMGSTLFDDDKPCRALVGTVFVDLVLAIFCSSYDLLTLPILTLKSLLEALMIITYKHDFGSMALRHLDVSLRKALRKILDFLLLDVSYELRQLALSVVQTYIKRGVAVTGVLAVESMDKAAALVVALKHNNEDALVSQAKAFIESTLSRLVPSGVYCSLCKRPPNHDFYEVLKTIIQTRDGRATEASINFQEDLLHSIISQPPEVDWKISHNTVENINMFVEVIYLAGWIAATARRAAGFSADSDFDLNTLLSLTANLIRLKRPSIQHVLWLIHTGFHELAGSANMAKTMQVQKLARSAIHFLQNYNWTTGETDTELTLSLTVGRYIFYAAERGYDHSFPSDITIRPWIIMLLTAVSTPSSEKYGALMMSRFDNFMVPYTKTLGTYVQGRLPPPETAAADIEYAYLAMKSWLLLLYKLSTGKTVDPSGQLTCKFWNELWPPFESLVKLLGQESSDELLPLSTAVWSSAANLFIFILQSRSSIAMDCVPCLTLMKHLRQLGGGIPFSTS